MACSIGTNYCIVCRKKLEVDSVVMFIGKGKLVYSNHIAFHPSKKYAVHEECWEHMVTAMNLATDLPHYGKKCKIKTKTGEVVTVYVHEIIDLQKKIVSGHNDKYQKVIGEIV